MEETKLKLRVLKGQDTFTLLRLFSKLGVKNLINEIFNQPKTDEENRGGQIISALAEALTEKLPDVQDELNAFLADLAETDVAVIIDLDFSEYMALIFEFFNKEELTNFIQQLSSFIK